MEMNSELGSKVLDYSSRIEKFMNLFGFNELDRDDYAGEPAESISSALKWICMDGRFPKDELDEYLEEYSFCVGSLAELLENELHKEKMDEFFVFLKNLREKM